MDKLLKLCDDMASSDEFVSLRGIIERYYGHEIVKVDDDREYKRLKKHLNRHSHIVEYQNGSNFRNGFRYKKGYERYFSSEEEKNALKNMTEDEKRLYLTGGLEILFEGVTSSKHLIELECVPDLKNKELVRELIKYLGRYVISFKYQPGYQKNKEIEVYLHPHLLKEYNSRWFLFGYRQYQDGTMKIENFSLDRIIRNSETVTFRLYTTIPFKSVPENFYYNYFKDIVGVTKLDDEGIEDIVLRTVDYKVHQLLKTKKIHSSQEQIMDYDPEKGYGEFKIRVIPNVELQTRILSYGPGLYVMGDSSFVQAIRGAVSQMGKFYAQAET